MSRRLLVVPAVAVLLAGCGSDTRPWPPPDPDRPVVDLAYTFSDDLASAQGIENVSFTPGTPVCEVVLRAWPNGPLSAGEGTRLTIRSVTRAGRSLPLHVEQAGAPAGLPGTLVRAPLPECSAPGERIGVQVAFDLDVGLDIDNRVGRSADPRMTWVGTAFPLLAWVQGQGWSTEPAVAVAGESAVAETFDLRRLDVTVPDPDSVAGIGESLGTAPGQRPGTTRHRFAAPATRDVAVTVGDLRTTEFEVDGTRFTLVTPSTVDTDAWTRQLSASLRGLADHFGPVPYEHLWITVAPDLSSGVEYSGAVQFSDVDPEEQSWLVTHELAHQWFYGLVGNDQGRHPFLDEAFATYAQEIVEPTSLSDRPEEWLGLQGEMGASMSDFAGERDPGAVYVATVYRGGGRALLEARQADGDPGRFDAAIAAYLHEEAHRVSTPADLEAHLAALPKATQVLRAAGAFG